MEKRTQGAGTGTYDVLRAMLMQMTELQDPYADVPDKNSPEFNKIRLLLRSEKIPSTNSAEPAETYETGLLTYGNANPDAKDFNSLADFCFSGDYVEIKIPWQLLNFSNPAEMQIHDDYYENYGVENMTADSMWAGIGSSSAPEARISMGKLELEGWGSTPTYHERLKESYYMVQKEETGGKLRYGNSDRTDHIYLYFCLSGHAGI